MSTDRQVCIVFFIPLSLCLAGFVSVLVITAPWPFNLFGVVLAIPAGGMLYSAIRGAVTGNFL